MPDTIILEGKTLSKSIMGSLPERIVSFSSAAGRPPRLVIINYFEDSPSAFYVKLKVAACEKLGIKVEVRKPSAAAGLKVFIALLNELAEDKSVDAIMIERPLPDGFEIPEMWDAIPAAKDVDALSSANMGRLFIARNMAEVSRGDFFVPCTALAVVKLLEYHKIAVSGKRIAIAGRSAVVGKPLAQMLTGLDATVTVCHTKTPDIAAVFKCSDIVVTAAGRACWLKPDLVASDAVIIDVGTNMDATGKLCGDADYEALKGKVKAITPVPGGVGPVTLACLLEASVKAAEKKGYN